LIFTVEALADGQAAGHQLQANGRYAHSSRYVGDAVSGAGLSLLSIKPVALRLEAGLAVAGYLVQAKKPGVH
jgi:predicted TPR repeat methyltransferase